MSDYTTTPNLGLFKPTFNADVGNWGAHWNQNADTLDAAVAAASSGAAVQDTAPAAPVNGMLWARTDGSLFVFSDASGAWIQIAGTP